MDEQDKSLFGDGSDNFAGAAGQMAKAARAAGSQSLKAAGWQAAEKGAETAVNTAAASVNAGIQTGKAVANIAAGTAAGGPWGAIASAVWSMRHTILKILVCVGLSIVFLVVLVISLPAIIFDSIFSLPDNFAGNSLTAAYSDLSGCIHTSVAKGHSYALNKVETIIRDGGYDYELSMDALADESGMGNYDVCYVLAAYSASKGQKDVNADNMVSLMMNSIDKMFAVTYEILQIEIPILSDLLEIIGTEIKSFVKCVIHPITNAFFTAAFGIDIEAKYGEFDITYGEAIDFMERSLKMTLGDQT